VQQKKSEGVEGAEVTVSWSVSLKLPLTADGYAFDVVWRMDLITQYTTPGC
jgi:hypothetical protein